ncbi:hypothetical protein [Aestuariimicrobium sp. T2.26MG-19.2B]|uniref:hypothetical protein n=1 Tax=Aestuariimicrobium sp. T2.26MG-19.2B TaxID=3040679 RepID=UPI002477C6F7|nr:hypothetical protein [Aestuariimicrobium sp. T2.26MG-19.2B]CAI9399706.1 hypothetical protein AESSP_00246 [Aestuariimicrobium sp. T2.26MG-19.2B]
MRQALPQLRPRAVGVLTVVTLALASSLMAACSTSGPSGPGTSARPPVKKTTTGRPSARTTSSAGPHSREPTRSGHTVRAATLGWRLPYPISRTALISSGATVTLAGGMPPDNSSSDLVVAVDLRTGSTTPRPRLAVKVHDAAGGNGPGAPTVYGGGNSSEQRSVQRLEGSAWRVVAPLSGTRSDLTTVPTPGGDLVIGGYDGTRAVTDVLLSGPSGLHMLGHLVRPVRYAGGALIGQTAYVVGGEVDGHELSVIQCVDVATGVARICGHLPRALGHSQVMASGDSLLIAGGRLAPHTLTDQMWWWNPGTGRFVDAGTLPTPLADASVTVWNGAGYLLGGESPQVTDAVVRVPLGSA